MVGRALANGRRVAVFTVLGNMAVEYVQVMAIAFGIGALVEQSVAALLVLKFLGGAYPVYLGMKTFSERKSLGHALSVPAHAHSDQRSFAHGFVVGVTNPKTVVVLAHPDASNS